MDAVSHVEAALERLTRDDTAALPPARRRRLQATLDGWACLCSDILHKPPPDERPGSATEGICPSCGDETARTTGAHQGCVAKEPPRMGGGVLALLAREKRSL
jgi:hypothetical protein